MLSTSFVRVNTGEIVGLASTETIVMTLLEGATDLWHSTGGNIFFIREGRLHFIEQLLVTTNAEIMPWDLGQVTLPGRAVRLVRDLDEPTCVILEDASLHCFGGVSVALGENGARKVMDDVVDAFGSNLSGCAVLESGRVRCWGNASRGERGNPDATNNTPSLVLQVEP